MWFLVTAEGGKRLRSLNLNMSSVVIQVLPYLVGISQGCKFYQNVFSVLASALGFYALETQRNLKFMWNSCISQTRDITKYNSGQALSK